MQELTFFHGKIVMLMYKIRNKITPLLLVAVCSSVFSQERVPHLVNVKLYADTLGYLDPLFLMAEIPPDAKLEFPMEVPMWGYYFSIYYRHADSSTWIEIPIDVPFMDVYSEYYEIVVSESNQSFDKKILCLQLAPISEHGPGCYESEYDRLNFIRRCFCPGNYWLKVEFQQRGGARVKRKSIKKDEFLFHFQVSEYYAPIDKSAAEWLTQTRYPFFSYAYYDNPIVFEKGGKSELALAFLSQFSGSRFAPFVHYDYAQMLSGHSSRLQPTAKESNYQQIITHLEAAQSGTDNPWLLARVEPELQRHRQLLSSLRSRMEWEKKQQEKQKKDGNE